MIATCIDSSALLRFVFEEGYVSLVHSALAGSPVAATLAAVEVPAAIHARRHRGLFTADRRDHFLVVATHLLDRLALIGLDSSVRRDAVRACEPILLRALDAIHVATAIAIARRRRRLGVEIRFCTADRRQAEAAALLLGASRVDLLPRLPAS